MILKDQVVQTVESISAQAVMDLRTHLERSCIKAFIFSESTFLLLIHQNFLLKACYTFYSHLNLDS